MNGTILITGGSGYVGQATVSRALAEGYAVTATYLGHPVQLEGAHWVQLDVRNASAVRALIAGLRPGAIVHAAAAWGTPETAQAVIVEGTQAVVDAARAVAARLINLSTDMVFDGEHAPYMESDRPHPISDYGRAKAEAEAIVAQGLEDHVTVRTSLVTCFSPPDPRTLEVLQALRAAGPGLTLFTDEYRCPVRTEDLAAALVELAGHAYRGILHVAGPERLSRYELGLRIAACLGMDGGVLRSGSSAASGMVRPRDCTLDTRLARAILRTRLRPLPQSG